LAAVLLLLTACHDAPRKNPFDPELTPPVELTVALDDTTGTATLTWTPYAGEAEFAEYRVLRNIFESIRIDTLEEITDPRQTAYTDTNLQPNTSYVYQVSVVNTDGFEQPSVPKRTDGYVTRSVRLLQTESPPGTGIINLTWTRYRPPRFESYQVYRSAVGTDQDSVLTIITDVGDTTFADTSALHEVDYLYSVVAKAAGQQLPSNSVEGRLSLTGVTITHAQFSSHTASCSLGWTPYAGPRFRAYEVRQHLEEIETQILGVIPERDRTHFIDTGLHGNKEYTYQVLVLTEAGEEIASQEYGDRFHHWVAEWSLEMEEMAAARLRATEAGHIEALVSSEEEVRLLVFDTGGSPQEEQILFVRDRTLGTAPRIVPQSVCTALGSDGRRFLTMARTDRMMVMAFTPGGEVITRDTTLFDMALPEGVAPEGEIALRVPTAVPAGYEQNEVVDDSQVQFDNVDVYASGQIVLQEDFDGGMPGDWEVNYALNGTNPWLSPEGILWFGCSSRSFAAGPVRRSDSLWREPGVQVGMLMSPGAAGIVTVGQRDGRRVWFWLIERFDTARLQVVAAEGSTTDYEVPIVLRPSIWYRVGLWVQDGRVTASVGEPFLWTEEREGMPRWGSMAVVEDFVAFTSDQQRHTISLHGDLRQSEQRSAATCDMRVWESGRNWQIALCLPDEHRVLVGQLGVSTWLNPKLNFPIDGAETSVVLGKGLGGTDGYLSLPLSIDRDPEGQYYVLDAGNARIQVFDAEGEYLTQWGTRGKDPGQFDFGAGHDLGKFAGSLCVDNDGYIYVADVGNRRIQKFAP